LLLQNGAGDYESVENLNFRDEKETIEVMS